MKVGVLSDTHNSMECAGGAIDLFRREGVEVIFHLGDVCTPGALVPLAGCGIPLIGVFGNNDFDKAGLQAASGNGFHQGPFRPEVNGRRILMAHAFDEMGGEIEERGKFDLILFGHTHRPLEMRVGRALVLNPGEGCGFLSGKATCAVVDLGDMKPRILEIGKPG